MIIPSLHPDGKLRQKGRLAVISQASTSWLNQVSYKVAH
jgi:hypothetical protein